MQYRYDANGNRTQTQLPNGETIDYLYYGSGHLSAIKYNGSLISEFERDKLHREVQRTQGRLTTNYELDPVGKLKTQLNAQIERHYHYDNAGNLTQSKDNLTQTTQYGYDKLGRLTHATSPLSRETFAFDPAHNIIEREGQKQQNNQVNHYHGTQYRYNGLGNLIERKLPTGEVQYYRYNLNDQLIEANITKVNGRTETWRYTYDPLGRRTDKRSENHKNLHIEFVWDGSHLIQERNEQNTYTYIYTHPNSYEPLAQIKENGEVYYYHCDQIGAPRELTNKNSELCWHASYKGWGELQGEHNLKGVHQPIRLQNQYADKETGLHYNFFRYYEPTVGRFTTQDPIGLAGGENLYRFAPNGQGSVDPLGLEVTAVYYREEQILKIKDLDTNKTIEGPFKTGANIFSSENTYSGPIPAGKYHILERQGKDDFFRLEPVDTNYGDDTHDNSGRNEFRLHKPGGSIGCITSLSQENWDLTNSFIRSTKKTTTQVNSKSRNPFKWGSKESINKYGELIVY